MLCAILYDIHEQVNFILQNIIRVINANANSILNIVICYLKYTTLVPWCYCTGVWGRNNVKFITVSRNLP